MTDPSNPTHIATVIGALPVDGENPAELAVIFDPSAPLRPRFRVTLAGQSAGYYGSTPEAALARALGDTPTRSCWLVRAQVGRHDMPTKGLVYGRLTSFRRVTFVPEGNQPSVNLCPIEGFPNARFDLPLRVLLPDIPEGEVEEGFLTQDKGLIDDLTLLASGRSIAPGCECSIEAFSRVARIAACGGWRPETPTVQSFRRLYADHTSTSIGRDSSMPYGYRRAEGERARVLLLQDIYPRPTESGLLGWREYTPGAGAYWIASDGPGIRCKPLPAGLYLPLHPDTLAPLY